MLPAVNMPTFSVGLPCSWKNSEIKNKLKIISVTVDWRFTKRNEATMHRIIASTKKTFAIRFKVVTLSSTFPLGSVALSVFFSKNNTPYNNSFPQHFESSNFQLNQR
jgi:hypothetical protein